MTQNSQSDSSKKVLITGATGYIGTQVCAELLKKDYEIHAIVLPNTVNDKLLMEQHELDLMDKQAVSDFFKDNKFEKLIHLAWYVGPKCQISPLNLEWLESSLHLIKTFSY